MRTIPDLPKEIDVLFYGSLNPRRKVILDRIVAQCKLRHLFGVYGEQRDALIARSKIVLNLHCTPAQIFEQTRVSYLLNNAQFVLCETSPGNPYEGIITTAPYDDLPEACRQFLANDAQRVQLAAESFEKFRQLPMTECLKPLLRY
jgi:hypothetical protein